MLIDAGWHVNDKQVERLWLREGLKVPMKQLMRSRLGSMTDRAFVSGRSTSIKFGHLTSSSKKWLSIQRSVGDNSARSVHYRLIVYQVAGRLSPSFDTISKFNTFRIPYKWDAICTSSEMRGIRCPIVRIGGYSG